jgi:hypothetical protein
MESLYGTIVGGALAILGGIVAKSFEEWRARKSLRAAFRAEILGIVRSIESHGFDKLLNELLQNWQAGRRGIPLTVGSRTKPVDPIFSKNTDKIGLLGRDVAGEVTRFYALIDGIRDDINALETGQLQGRSRKTRIRFIEEDLTRWVEAREIACQLERLL